MKLFFLFLFFIFSYLNIHAQPLPLWIRQFNSGGTNSDNIVDAKLDKVGNVYIAGYIKNNDTTHSFLTIKYNTNGDFLWFKTYNCMGGWDEPIGLEVDNEGNVYVAGRSDTINSSQNLRICFCAIKYSTNGDLLWIKKYINEDSILAVPKAMCIDDSANIYITGRCSNLTPYGKTATIKYNKYGDIVWVKFQYFTNIDSDPECISYKNDFIYLHTSDHTGNSNTVKYKINGTLIWAISHNNFYGYKIINDDSNSIFIGGGYNINQYTAFKTNKYDSSGTLLWSKIYYDTNWYNPSNHLKDICIDKSNNVFVTGRGARDIPFGYCFSTIKYGKNGDSLWTRIYHNAYHSNDIAESIITDKFNNVYVTGSTDSSTLFYKFLTIKYDSSGLIKWAAKFPIGFGFTSYLAQFIKIDTAQNIYILGTNRIGDWGYDIFILKYSTTTGINNITSEIPKSSVLYQNYPNPFNQDTKIKYQVGSINNRKYKDKNIYTILKIYNILGKEAGTLVEQKQSPGVYEVTFDANNLSTGIYFYRLILNGNVLDTKKLVLIK